MRRFEVTASGLWRAFVCLGSAILPRTSSTNEDGERGTAIHAFLMNVNRLGRDQALALVEDAFRSACALLEVERLPVDPACYAAEVALAFDVRTGRARELHRKGDRDYYGATDSEICGTPDVVTLLGDDAAIVYDYKSGHAYLPRPDDNWQFKFLGLAVARAFNRSTVYLEMIRLGEDGFPYPIRGRLDLFDLAQISEDLRRLHADGTRAAAADAELPLVTGSHCVGCPCVLDCRPAKALIRAPRDQDARIVGLAAPGGLVTNEDVLEARGVRDALKAFLELLEDQIETVATARYQAGEPVTFPDGSVLIPVERPRSEPNGTAAWNMIANLFDAKTAWESVEIKATWEAFRDLAKKEAERLNKVRADGAKKVTIKGIFEGWRGDLERMEAEARDAGRPKGTFVKHNPYTAVMKVPASKLLPPKERR